MEAEINIILSLLLVYASESLQSSVCASVPADVTAWHLSCRFSSSLCVS